MRTMSLCLFSFVVSCSTQGGPSSQVRYSTYPGTDDCVVDPSPDGTPGWEECDPTCNDMNDGTTGCTNECPDIACITDEMRTDGTIPCPYGFKVDERGCPTCECYEPDPCNDGTPTMDGQCGCNEEPPPDPCSELTTEEDCTARMCQWIALGEPCTADEMCRTGVCQSYTDPGGTGQCPDGSTDCENDPAR